MTPKYLTASRYKLEAHASYDPHRTREQARQFKRQMKKKGYRVEIVRVIPAQFIPVR